MNDLHPTYPARTGASGVVLWLAVAIAVVAAAGFVVTIAIGGA
jgi:hypothetical protein